MNVDLISSKHLCVCIRCMHYPIQAKGNIIIVSNSNTCAATTAKENIITFSQDAMSSHHRIIIIIIYRKYYEAILVSDLRHHKNGMYIEICIYGNSRMIANTHYIYIYKYAYVATYRNYAANTGAHCFSAV